MAGESVEERLERFEQTLLKILIPVCIIAVVIALLLVLSVIFSVRLSYARGQPVSQRLSVDRT